MVGAPLGFARQRTNLCFNSAYREALLNRNAVFLRGIALAILVQAVGLALVQLGVGEIQINIVSFFWLAAIVGGFVFGVAMVYAEGCSSTMWYRVGNDNLGALVTLIGFAVAEAATLPNTLGISPWFIVLPLTLIVGAWLGNYMRFMRPQPIKLVGFNTR